MRRALAVALAGAAAAAAVAAPAVVATPTTLAVIGDTPYGAAQYPQFPALVDHINADRDVRTVVHVGDIKSGSTVCSDAYFGQIRDQFDTFKDPLVYTPGDNEWTDCHRANNGAYLPSERLETLRRVFFPVAGRTLGEHTVRVDSQAFDPRHAAYRENTLWTDRGVVYAALHVVGSNNDLLPWFGAAETPAQRDARVAEYADRMDANLAWIDRTFATATQRHAPAVVLVMQADMWDAFSVANGLPLDGFNPIVQRLADRAAEYERPVLVVQGDSHGYLVDTPLADGSPVHGVTTEAPNVTRLVVEGAQTTEWLRLTVRPRSVKPFTFERVPVS